MRLIAIGNREFDPLALSGSYVRRSLRLLIRSALIGLVFGGPVLAEGYIKATPRPDPATVRIPELQATTEPESARNYDKFFVYWKHYASYQIAFDDLDQCRAYGLEMRLVTAAPVYAPMGANEINKPEYHTPYIYGIVGGIVGDYFIDRAQKDNYIQTEKRCMAYKGYSRFGVSRAIWTEIMTGEEADVLARRALIAAGAKPATESVDP